MVLLARRGAQQRDLGALGQTSESTLFCPTTPIPEATAAGPEGRQRVAQRVSAGSRPKTRTSPGRGDRKPILSRPGPPNTLPRFATITSTTDTKPSLARLAPGRPPSVLRVRPLGLRQTRLAAKITRTRKEVLLPSDAHLTLPRNVVPSASRSPRQITQQRWRLASTTRTEDGLYFGITAAHFPASSSQRRSTVPVSSPALTWIYSVPSTIFTAR